MLEAVKLAIPISTDAYDADLTDLIAAALADLGIAGVTAGETAGKDTDPLVKRAVITYCRKNFGSPDDYERLARSYDEQKAQLSMATGYTAWGESE